MKPCSLYDRRNPALEDYVGDTRSKDSSCRLAVDVGVSQPRFREVGNGAVDGRGRCRHSSERGPWTWAWPSRLDWQSRPSLWMVYRPRKLATPSLMSCDLKPMIKSRRANRRLLQYGRFYFLRLSFMRSPGESSDAPFDCPTVPLSCMRSPGLYSDAPGPALVFFEFCIS